MEPRTMNPTVSETMGDLANRAHEAVDETASRVEPAVNRARDKAHEAIDRVHDRVSPTARRVESAGRDAGDRSMQFADACAESIRARPIAAVGAALAIGWLIGRLGR